MRIGERPDFKRRREQDFWQPVNRIIVSLILIGVLVLCAVGFVRELGRAEDMRAKLAALERDLEAEELKLLQKRREESWLKNEPEYVESLARDGLNLMKEGETIFRLDEAVPTPFPDDQEPGLPPSRETPDPSQP